MKSINIDKSPDNGARIEIIARYMKKGISDLNNFSLFPFFKKNRKVAKIEVAN